MPSLDIIMIKLFQIGIIVFHVLAYESINRKERKGPSIISRALLQGEDPYVLISLLNGFPSDVGAVVWLRDVNESTTITST